MDILISWQEVLVLLIMLVFTLVSYIYDKT